MIEAVSQDIFHLRTRNSSYLIQILASGHAGHLYYGHVLRDPAASRHAIAEKRYTKPGMSASFGQDYPTLVLDDMPLEASAEGFGDYRTPFAAIYGNGDRSLDFRFTEARKYNNPVLMQSGLPQTKDRRDEAETLELVLQDKKLSLELKLFYTAYPSLDAITRRAVLINRGGTPVVLRALASAQLDIRADKLKLTTFSGAWGREFSRSVRLLDKPGTVVSESMKLNYSAEANPGFLIEEPYGGACACNLLYSGPHRMSASVSAHGLIHIVWGINPEQFSWTLGGGESFESPEAVMTWAEDAQSASARMREFTASAVIRSRWHDRMSPIMLSTRDSLGYNPTEDKVLALARKAKELGLEGILVEDGWFGARENESTSLGDWSANTLKFPSGLYETAKDVHKLGLFFGLGFEPESVSAQSELYRKHPGWCLGNGNVKLLDLSQDEVVDYITGVLTSVIKNSSVDYLLWNLGHLSPAISSGAFAHKYVLGLYKALDTIGRTFPDLYIETSSGGGGRFDLGMLSYSSSITLSSNTDPAETVRMVSSASSLYPVSAIGTTVTGDASRRRKASLETLFNTAAFGVLSYSLDLVSMPKHLLRLLKAQVDFYKAHRLVFQYGIFSVEEEGNRTIWTSAKQDGSLILAMYFQKLAKPDTGVEKLRILAADPAENYIVHPRSHLLETDQTLELIMESTSYKLPGDALRWAGICLPEQISGSGYTHGMRTLGDFSSRLYLIRRTENE